jgi:hypothetical protein
VSVDEEEGGDSMDGSDDRLCCSIMLQDDLRVGRAPQPWRLRCTVCHCSLVAPAAHARTGVEG